MKKSLLLIAAYCISMSSWGQDRSVSGEIVSEHGVPVKNIKISVIDLPISTKTNKNGKFRLNKVRSEDSIVVHIDKKAYAKFLLGDNDSIKLVLSNKAIAIHNNANTHIKSSDIESGTLYNNELRAASLITSKMLERTHAITIGDAIKGMAAGVNIQTTAEGAYVTMREGKSLNLSQNSLIIIDGQERSVITNDILVNDVESIEIIKDGFGYGVKGANGVVVIKTKR